MDKIKKYQKILESTLTEYAQTFGKQGDPVENQVICDTKRNHFQLLTVGWEKDKFSHYIVFHFEIRAGKVWLWENRTDIRIAQELVEKGIPKTDIVLGLKHPSMRPFTGFAAA